LVLEVLVLVLEVGNLAVQHLLGVVLVVVFLFHQHGKSLPTGLDEAVVAHWGHSQAEIQLV
jgi:hypothetical protein